MVAKARGTTKMTADKFMRKSNMSRPATDGNKNVKMSKQPNMAAAGQKSMVSGVFASTHTGPYLGKKST